VSGGTLNSILSFIRYMLKPQHICTLIDHNNDRSKEIQRTQRQAAVGEPGPYQWHRHAYNIVTSYRLNRHIAKFITNSTV